MYSNPLPSSPGARWAWALLWIASVGCPASEAPPPPPVSDVDETELRLMDLCYME